MGMEEKKSINGGEEIQNGDEIKKFCSDCKTTKTPLWRVGPDGPKSLCNACGIRYRKKRRAILGSDKKKERSAAAGDDGGCGGGGKIGSSGDGNKGLREDLKVRLKMVFQSSSSVVKKQRCQRRKKLLLGEEEQAAAFCLMALSSGSVSVFA